MWPRQTTLSSSRHRQNFLRKLSTNSACSPSSHSSTSPTPLILGLSLFTVEKREGNEEKATKKAETFQWITLNMHSWGKGWEMTDHCQLNSRCSLLNKSSIGIPKVTPWYFRVVLLLLLLSGLFLKSWTKIFLLEMKKNSWVSVLLKHCKTIHSLYFQGIFCVQNKTVTKIKLLLCYSEEDFVRQPRIFSHYFRLSLSLTLVIIIFLLLCINRKHEPTLSRSSWDEWSHLPGLHT